MSITQTVFKIRVVYKSGYTHDFECTSFRGSGKGYEWMPDNNHNKPIMLGADEIAAVWQVGYRHRLRPGWWKVWK